MRYDQDVLKRGIKRNKSQVRIFLPDQERKNKSLKNYLQPLLGVRPNLTKNKIILSSKTSPPFFWACQQDPRTKKRDDVFEGDWKL
jgi:hypothetical protein